MQLKTYSQSCVDIAASVILWKERTTKLVEILPMLEVREQNNGKRNVTGRRMPLGSL